MTEEKSVEDLLALYQEDESMIFHPLVYVLFFIGPAAISVAVLYFHLGLEPLYSGIVGLAVMNGSINSVIAYLTIRLDDKSSEALEHLAVINQEMDKLETTLDEANTMVSSFTGDLDEAKARFTQVGLDLVVIDDVVAKLAENKDSISELLDSMKDMDVSSHLEQAKSIDWKQLLDSVEEVLGFIQSKKDFESGQVAAFSDMKPVLPSQITEEVEEDYEEVPEWVQYQVADYLEEPEPEPEPEPQGLTLKRLPQIKRKPSLNLERRR